jgi:signal transduction histidine kinase
MRYDDRLATVLRIRPASPAVARIQFQQLVDLLGTSPADTRGTLLDDAYTRIAELRDRIPAGERAAALGMRGLRLRSPRLVAELCAGEPLVARAAILAADLDEPQWLDLIPALPPANRGLLRARQDLSPPVRALLARLGIGDAPLPPAASIDAVENGAANDSAAEPERSIIDFPQAKPEPARAASGIGAIVKRIEAFRHARDVAGHGPAAPASELPQLPLGDMAAAASASLTAIDFTTDPAGRIAWCAYPAGPMLVGTSLGAIDTLRTAIRQRQPIVAASLGLGGAPAIAGQWQVDAVPRFEAGRFTGYIGRLRRPAMTDPAPASVATREADNLRQVLHELRTPVNAIQGFAEIIQHQLYGPAPHEYRALAAAIVADSARMLAGFEELERLARLQTGAVRPEAGESDLAEIAAAAVARLQPQAEARGFAMTLGGGAEPQPGGLAIRLAQADAERLVWRVLTALGASAGPGENLACLLSGDGRNATLAIALPAGLAGSQDDLFSASQALVPAGAPLSPGGLFGMGFALRLARAEARASGGSLERRDHSLNLSLPLLTSIARHGDNDGQGGARERTPAA